MNFELATILSFLAMFIAPIVHGAATLLLLKAHLTARRLIPALRERLLASQTWTIVATIVAFVTVNRLTNWPVDLSHEQSQWLITLALWLSTLPSIRFLRMYYRHEFRNRQGVERLRRELDDRRLRDNNELATRRTNDREELATRRAED